LLLINTRSNLTSDCSRRTKIINNKLKTKDFISSYQQFDFERIYICKRDDEEESVYDAV